MPCLDGRGSGYALRPEGRAQLCRVGIFRFSGAESRGIGQEINRYKKLVPHEGPRVFPPRPLLRHLSLRPIAAYAVRAIPLSHSLQAAGMISVVKKLILQSGGLHTACVRPIAESRYIKHPAALSSIKKGAKSLRPPMTKGGFGPPHCPFEIPRGRNIRREFSVWRLGVPPSPNKLCARFFGTRGRFRGQTKCGDAFSANPLSRVFCKKGSRQGVLGPKVCRTLPQTGSAIALLVFIFESLGGDSIDR